MSGQRIELHGHDVVAATAACRVVMVRGRWYGPDPPAFYANASRPAGARLAEEEDAQQSDVQTMPRPLVPWQPEVDGDS